MNRNEHVAWYEKDGQKLAYLDAGQGEGAPLILLHGFCGSSGYWDDVIPLLASGRRVIAPDLRGHGQSSAPEGGAYPMEAFADDIAGLLEHLRIERAIVLGHSLGGYITLAFAERHADKLAGFGLIHSTAYPDDEKGKAGRLKGQQTIREEGLPVFLDGLIPRLFAPEHLEAMPGAVRKAMEIGLETNPAGAVSMLEGMRLRPERNRVLEQANVPVLLVAGKKDQIVAPERTFSASGSRIAQHTIPTAGHMSMMEAPEQLADIVRGFADTCG